MSKSQRERASDTRRARMEEPLIPAKYQHAAAAGFLLLTLVIFFYPVTFGGKTFLAPDNVASHSFDSYLADAKKEGIFPLWNPYIFCGMPGYGSLTTTGDRWFDVSLRLYTSIAHAFGVLTTHAEVGNIIFYYFLMGVGTYVFVFRRLQSKVAALLASSATVYSMFIILWIMIGHNTKVMAISMFPFILLLVEESRQGFRWWQAFVLILAIHFLLASTHVQMIFYVFFAIGVYYAFYLVRSFMKKDDWRNLARSAGVFVAAAAIAFTMDSDRYLSVLEYNPHSIRGSAPITASLQGSGTKTQAGGLDYDYATSWSLAPGEVVSFVVPFWYGFGWHTYQGPLTQNQQLRANTYFGPQPFTDAAQYVGVVVAALALVGFVRTRGDPFVHYLLIVIIFSLLVAFGKEFPLVYDLMYKYFPGFNKFRIPSMILVLVQIFIPILAAYGVASFLKQKEENKFAEIQKTKKNVVRGLVIVAAVCVGLGMMFESLLSRQDTQNMVQSFYQLGLPRDRVVDQVFQQVPANVIQMLKDHVSTMVATDLYVGLALLVVTFGAFVFYLQDKLKLNTLVIVLVLVVLTDLWRVDYRPMHPEERRQKSAIFTASGHVQYLQKDSTLFRVIQFVGGQPPYDNTLAYWRIQNAYGYQGAKMRAYQDVVEVVGLHNPLLWQLMNVKYIINDQVDSSRLVGLVYNGPETKVYATRDFFPRAFFVNRYEVAGGLEILQKIKSLSFDARDVAYFSEDPKLQVDAPQSAAQATFVKYNIQDFELRVTSTGNNLLFLSETYYPVGWKAFIDGKETQIYRLNYLFRGVLVPPGEHKLEMKLEPVSFYFGKNLSLGTNTIVLGALLFFGVDYWRKRKKVEVSQ